MTDLTKFKLAYLATPYSKYPDGLEMAFEVASAHAAVLLSQGVKVYSPIAHTHPIAMYGNLDPYDHEIWLPFDTAMMDASEAIIVDTTMEGWDGSKGIAYEIDYFTKQGKPVLYL